MKKLYFLLFLSLSFLINAQNPGEVAQNFGAFPGFNATVSSIAVQTDGKKILAGQFTSYNGVTENRIIRLNSNGTKDVSFNIGTGFNSQVNAIAIQSDGKILIGGNFTTYNGTTGNRIIRLNTDGTNDTTFTTGIGFNNSVNSIALQSDGKIIVGGLYTAYNGLTENGIVRLNTNGTKDTTFTTGTGFNNNVLAIAVQTDGKIIVGGAFTTYNSVTETRIVRLNSNGTKDTSFTVGSGFNSFVFSIALQSDGKIIIGGLFNTYNGVTENRIVRLNTNGTKDPSFTTGVGFSGQVNSIALQSDGKIMVGGDFTSYNGVTENRIIRLNSDGIKDSTFTTGTGFNNRAISITVQSDGKIIIGGLFTTYNGATENYIVLLNSDGTKDTSFTVGTGFNSFVNAITIQPDGKTIVGGFFISYNGTTENYITRLNSDGTKDTSFTVGTGFNSFVNAITIQPDGKIIVGGDFTSYNGVTENRIIRLNSDGTKDTSFTIGTGFNQDVRSIVLQPDGKIIIGGFFTTYNGTTENRIVRLNTDGTKDTSFTTGTGFDNSVLSITIQTDGKIIIGGVFTAYNGATENRIVRLNTTGTKDTSFTTGTGFGSNVHSITLQTDGKIIVGGDFTSYNSITENRLVRLNATGTKDASFSAGTGFDSRVTKINLQSDGKIIVVGLFFNYNSVTENRIVRLNSNGTKDTSFTTGTGFNDNVYAIALKSDGGVIVGGAFTTYNNSPASAHLIGLYNDAFLSNLEFLTDNELSLWPNPTKNSLNISSLNNNVTSISIYNLQGKMVYNNTNSATIINVSDLTSGLYLAKIVTEKGEVTKKFIKE